MKIKILFMLVFVAWQVASGSKSKSKGRLQSWFKKCLTLLVVNETFNFKRRIVPDSSALACKYTLPDQNAPLMMHYIMCAKEPDFEKYLDDNSGNCLKVKELYENIKRIGLKCALDFPKNIVKAAFARLLGEKVSHETNAKMLQEYMATTEFSGETKSELLEHAVNKAKGRNFDFFQFENMLQLTRMMTKSESWIRRPLDDKDKDFNANHKKRVFELVDGIKLDHIERIFKFTKPAQDFNAEHVKQLLKSKPMKGVKLDHVRRIYELTKLNWEYSSRLAVKEALEPKYKDVNAPHADNIVMKLTKFMHPEDIALAVNEALKPKYKNLNVSHAEEILKLTKAIYPNDIPLAVKEAIRAAMMYPNDIALFVDETLPSLKPKNSNLNVSVIKPNDIESILFLESLKPKYKNVNIRHAKKMLKLTTIMHPNDVNSAVKEALKPKYKYINVEKVHEKFLELLRLQKSDPSDILKNKLVKIALKMKYSEIVKEDI
jgi:hypothetical protein